MRVHRKQAVRLLAVAFTGLLLGMTVAVTPASATPLVGADGAGIDFHEWHAPVGFGAGEFDGLAPTPTGLVFGHAIGTIEYTDPDLKTTKPYEYATWTSPVHWPGFGATQLVASWNATTPAGTWLQVEMRGRTNSGSQTGWYVMGRWASGDSDIHRTSVPDQSTAAGQIDVDTFEANAGVTLDSYQLRVTLYRAPGERATPTLRMIGAMTSAVPARFTVPASPLGGAEGITLNVPQYSQDVHDGQYPQWDGGGEAWCSPTSTEMVTEYWGKYPSAAQLSFVDPSYADPSVDVAARGTFDYNYDGTGNWPFNAAYAASYGLYAHITRLHSLDELESYIKRGIPVITSQSFEASELTGAGYSTAGHLMVVVGFTKSGDVIVNDPASPTDAAVRRVYNRRQFENIWLRTERVLPDGSIGGGSGGVAYIITPPGMGG